MRNTVIDGQSDLAAAAVERRCMFFCEYVSRDKSWQWRWRPATQDIGEPFTNSVFGSLNDCLQDAAQHGFQRDHISIRYSARQPGRSLLEKFDDRSKEFVRALKNLIPNGKLKPRPVDTAYSEMWRDTPSDEHRSWQFSGSPQTIPGELSGTNHLR